MFNKRVKGMTLVELVIAIVIIGVALAGLVAALTRASRASANPIVTQQMLAIGESMMEEILLKPFGNPTGAATRANFAAVRDYDPVDDGSYGYASNGITNIDGDPLPGLDNYNVTVRVNQAGVTLTSVPAGQALRVIVTVTHGNERLVLTGWKTAP